MKHTQWRRAIFAPALLVGALAFAGRGAAGPVAGEPFTVETFRFEYDEFINFCPRRDGVCSAEISRQNDGGYLLRMTVLEGGGPVEENFVVLDPRRLTTEEVTLFLSLSEDIIQNKVIPCPLQILERKFPWR